ncbi:hypothetical protein C2S52_023128 [Perilla frutescens var. hirtella]|nr:hypothetical protein C2S52_023128 [Perilla frutescens var. hirtella]
MAARFSLCSSPMTTPKHAPSMRLIGSSRLRVGCLITTSSKLVMMCSNNHVSVDVQTRSSSPHMNKIFEDRSAGIVCYRDENGEITCEGYDEGPRFHHKLSRFNYNTSVLTRNCIICDSRDVEIIELLQRCWNQESQDKEGN